MAISEVGNAFNFATTGTAVSVTHGLTINVGDFVFAQINVNTVANTITENNGSTPFTQTLQEAHPGLATARYMIAMRIAGSSEPASYNWTLNSTDRWSVLVRVFRASVGTLDWDVTPSASTRANGASASADAPSVTVADNALGLVAYFIDIATTGPWFSSPTNSYTNEVQPTTPSEPEASYSRQFTTGGATGVTSATILASSDWTAHQCSIKEILATAVKPGGGLLLFGVGT